MQTWEYFTRRIDADLEAVSLKDEEKRLDDYLDMMGEKGWELVAAAPIVGTDISEQRETAHLLYFKRPTN
jgi:hypothetical protein